jgi:hypothetical protein
MRHPKHGLVIEQLQDDGSYATAESSRFLPVRSDEVLQWLIAEDFSDELAWERRLDAWEKRVCRRRSRPTRGNHSP